MQPSGKEPKNYYIKTRDVLFEFHLKWNTASIAIPVRSLL